MREREDFVRRRWCLRLAVALVLLGALMNLVTLFWQHPFDLSGDECHYWEWSRHLDYGYYSKPPGIAWVIWAAVKIGRAVGLAGDGSGACLMPIIRLPAVLFGALAGLLSLFLARRMFRDDRAALAVTLLSAAVPMFAIGSLLITIDSPMYLCWAATIFCLWRAVEERSGERRGWIGWLYLAGLACAAGMLFKPVLIAIPLCAFVAAFFDRVGGSIRRVVWSLHGIAAFVIVLLSQVPVVIWNAQHHWVMFQHIGAQGGITRGTAHFNMLKSVTEFITGQAGGMGGLMFGLLIAGVVAAIRFWRQNKMAIENPRAAAYRFLLWFAMPLWLFYLLLSFRKGTEINWPAASYFAGMILLGGVVTERWNAAETAARRPWRVWTTIAVAWGILLTAVALNVQRIYPLAAAHLASLKGTPQYTKSIWYPGRWDPAMKKLRGQEQRAQVVETARTQLARQTGTQPFIVTNRYDTSSALTFYMPGHPFVYCLMSSVDRGNQFDLWPGPNQQGSGGRLLYSGKPALIVGGFDDNAVNKLLRPAFDKLEGPDHLPVWYHGIMIGDITLYRGYGFKGFPKITHGTF